MKIEGNIITINRDEQLNLMSMRHALSQIELKTNWIQVGCTVSHPFGHPQNEHCPMAQWFLSVTAMKIPIENKLANTQESVRLAFNSIIGSIKMNAPKVKARW